MTAQIIISDLQAAGVNIWIEDGKLKCKGPEVALTDEVVNRLKANKPEIIQLLQTEKKPTRARGFGCIGCGNRIYEAIQGWEMSELPESSPWTHEHTPVTNWKCQGCGAIFEIIGGSNGPQIIN